MSYGGSRADGTSRKVIDVAVGVLVGLRGCSEAEAFDELVRVVHQTGIGIGSTAAGLWHWQAAQRLRITPKPSTRGAS